MKITETAALLTAIGLIVSGATWLYHNIDPFHTTEAELVQYSEEHMANKTDVNHVVNLMVDEQIMDAQTQIEDLEDKVDAGEATPADIRKIQRLGRDIAKYKRNYVEDGHKHD